MAKKISEYFKTAYVDFGSFDNYRKIANYVDGFKVSGRKVMYTVMQHPKEEVKVSVLQSRTSENTRYLHGDQSLFGVIVGLAQDFPGTNNAPLLKRQGNFGNRHIPEASAGRYIFTKAEDILPLLFHPLDASILEEQVFEGDKIEPRFYVPTIPLLLVNGSEGLSTGFAQRILPREIKRVIHAIRAKLDGKKNVDLTPSFRGFTGTVTKGAEDGSYEIRGVIKRVNTTRVLITELPVGYDLKSYCKVLDRLEEADKIKGYEDLSTDDKFTFEVDMKREVLASLDDESLLTFFRLVKKETENYVCNDENNRLREFKSSNEVLEAFVEIRMRYYQKRKDYIVNRLKREIAQMHSKYLFIKGVIEKTINVENRSEEDVIKQLEKIGEIVKIEDSYNYLLNMPMKSMTKEVYRRLKDDIQEAAAQLKDTSKKEPKDLWLADLDALQNAVRSF